MMNRIILIGNGFDLAHGLPTSYADFIRGYNITLKLGLLEVNMSDMMVYVLSIFLIRRIGKSLEQFRWMLQDNTFRFIRNLGRNNTSRTI